MIFLSTKNTPPKPKRDDPEHRMQVALFSWARIAANLDPRLRLLYAVPNGGHRCKRTAARLKAEGQKAGVPDVHLPISSAGYHGLWIELKIRPNKPTDLQTQWHDALRATGHRVEVIYDDWNLARELIEQYLKT